MTIMIAATAGLLAVAAGGARAAGDPTLGKQVFQQQCAACHSIDPAVSLSGPTLKGVVGRKAGSLDDYDYSTAMLSYGKTWDPATLDAYLASPQTVVPGTKMPYPGLKNADQRSALIAYLATLK